MKDSTFKNKVLETIFSVSSLLIILFIWIIISTIYKNDLIFPSVISILKALGQIIFNLSSLKVIFMTILRVLISVAICFLMGFMISGIYIYSKTSLAFFRPIINIMRSMPLAVISIFIFILIGDKLGPYLITILMSLPVVIEGLITAIDNIEPSLIDEVKMLKGSTLTKITKVYIPIIMPYVLMCLIQTLGMSFKVMIMGEYICQTNNSIGKALYGFKGNLEMDLLIAYGIVIVVICLILEYIIKKIKQKLLKKY